MGYRAAYTIKFIYFFLQKILHASWNESDRIYCCNWFLIEWIFSFREIEKSACSTYACKNYQLSFFPAHIDSIVFCTHKCIDYNHRIGKCELCSRQQQCTRRKSHMNSNGIKAARTNSNWFIVKSMQKYRDGDDHVLCPFIHRLLAINWCIQMTLATTTTTTTPTAAAVIKYIKYQSFFSSKIESILHWAATVIHVWNNIYANIHNIYELNLSRCQFCHTNHIDM